MLDGFNFTRGFLRLWVVATVAWFGLAAFLAWDQVTIETRGRYQYSVEMRDGIANPFDDEHIAKPFLEVFRKPSEHKFPPRFDRVEYRFQDGFDGSVKAGAMVLVDFPDYTSLYLNTAFEKPEQELVSRWFWEQRWQRRFQALGSQSVLLGLAVVPPLLLLGLWFVGRWIVAGFRRA